MHPDDNRCSCETPMMTRSARETVRQFHERAAQIDENGSASARLSTLDIGCYTTALLDRILPLVTLVPLEKEKAVLLHNLVVDAGSQMSGAVCEWMGRVARQDRYTSAEFPFCDAHSIEKR